MMLEISNFENDRPLYLQIPFENTLTAKNKLIG